MDAKLLKETINKGKEYLYICGGFTAWNGSHAPCRKALNGHNPHLPCPGCEDKKIAREVLNKILDLTPIPEYGNLFTLEDFKSLVTNGLITDYDGAGHFATENEMIRGRTPLPASLLIAEVPEWATHIVWFNK